MDYTRMRGLFWAHVHICLVQANMGPQRQVVVFLFKRGDFVRFTVSLRENTLFKRAYYRGKKLGSALLAVYVRKNGLPYNRLGLTASKKIGGACVRNRARRVMKEAYRLTEHLFPKGYDIVLVARGVTSEKKTQDIVRVLSLSAKKLSGDAW